MSVVDLLAAFAWLLIVVVVFAGAPSTPEEW